MYVSVPWQRKQKRNRIVEGKKLTTVLQKMPFWTAQYIIDCCMYSKQEQSRYASNCIAMNGLIQYDM